MLHIWISFQLSSSRSEPDVAHRLHINPWRRWNSTAHSGIPCVFPSQTYAEAGLDATWHYSLLSSGLKVKRKMIMPISRTIINTPDVRRKARHAGLPTSRLRASFTPLAVSRSLAGGLGSPTSRERSDLRRHLRIPVKDLHRKEDMTFSSCGG